jgi:hypothetical protein
LPSPVLVNPRWAGRTRPPELESAAPIASVKTSCDVPKAEKTGARYRDARRSQGSGMACRDGRQVRLTEKTSDAAEENAEIRIARSVEHDIRRIFNVTDGHDFYFPIGKAYYRCKIIPVTVHPSRHFRSRL